MDTFFKPTPRFRKLQILLQISNNSHISQSRISKNIGIAASMVNSYLQRLKKEKLIRYAGDNHKQTEYFLTEKGEDEKRLLLHQYMNETIGIYKKAKHEFHVVLKKIITDGSSRVIFYGAAETCEIVIAAARELGIEIKALVDENVKKQGTYLFGLKISSPDILENADIDAVCITSYGYRNEIFGKIQYLQDKGIKIYMI